MSFTLQLLGASGWRVNSDALFGQECRVAQQHRALLDAALDTAAGDRLEILASCQLDAALHRSGDHRRRQRMLTAALQARRQAEQLSFLEAACRLDDHQT